MVYRDVKVRFKTARIDEEWDVLSWKLRASLLALSMWAEDELGKDLVITCLHRTTEENAAVGGVPNSLHTKDMAADIRTRGWTPKEIVKAKTFWDTELRRDNCFQMVVEKDHIHVELDNSVKKLEVYP